LDAKLAVIDRDLQRVEALGGSFGADRSNS